MQDPTFLAYLAGIIDGEGSVNIERAAMGDYSAGYRYQGKLVVRIRERWLLEEFHAVYGGSLTTVGRRSEGHSPVGSWRLTDRGAAVVLEDVMPFLRLKRAQALVFLELRRIKESFVRGYRASRTTEQVDNQAACYERMRMLNTRGTSRLTHD